MSAKENKLVKTVMDAAVLVGLSAGVGWLGRKALKEPLISDPSANVMNYAKWVAVLSGSIALRDWLVKEKMIPDNS